MATAAEVRVAPLVAGDERRGMSFCGERAMNKATIVAMAKCVIIGITLLAGDERDGARRSSRGARARVRNQNGRRTHTQAGGCQRE